MENIEESEQKDKRDDGTENRSVRAGRLAPEMGSRGLFAGSVYGDGQPTMLGGIHPSGFVTIDTAVRARF